MKKASVRILLVALLISVVFAVPVFAINLPTVEVHYKPTKDNSTSPHEMKFDDPVIEDGEIVDDSDDTPNVSAFPDEEISIDFDDSGIEDGEVVSDSDDNLTASVIADGNMAILLCIVAVAAGAVTVLLLKKRKVKKDD